MTSEDRAGFIARQVAIAKALTKVDLPITVAEKASLADLDQDEIDRSAETLIRKRLSQTRSSLPWSAILLGDTFSREFRLFAASHFFHGTDAIYRDAIEFARWLARRHPEPPWLQDALRWECCRCEWDSSRFYFTFFRMRYLFEPGVIVSNTVEPARCNHWVWMWRLGRRGGIRVSPGFTYERRPGKTT